MLRSHRGQAIAEYLLLLGIVAAAILGMQVYARRGIQAALKAVADDLSPVPGDGEAAQIEGIRQEAGESSGGAPRGVAARGVVVDRDSSFTTTERSEITRSELAGGGHKTDYGAGATTTTTGTSSSSVVTEIK